MPHNVLIQYTPDPVRHERVNIGIVVVDNGVAKAAFPDDFSRAVAFAGHPLLFLEHLKELSKGWTEVHVRRLIDEPAPFAHVVYIMIGCTTLPIDEAVADCKKRYL